MIKLTKEMLEEMILSELETPIPSPDAAASAEASRREADKKLQAKKDPFKKEIDTRKQIAIDVEIYNRLKKFAKDLGDYNTKPLQQTQTNINDIRRVIDGIAQPPPEASSTQTVQKGKLA